MKVKIGNRIYDAENEPILVILSNADKRNIANMLPNCTKYCAYPAKGYSKKYIEKFIEAE